MIIWSAIAGNAYCPAEKIEERPSDAPRRGPSPRNMSRRLHERPAT